MQVKTIKNIEEIKDSLQLLSEFNNDCNEKIALEQALSMVEHGYLFGIVTSGEKIIGITICKAREKLFYGKILQIDEFFIHRGYRGIGVGKMLISWLKWQAMEANCKNISCTIGSTRKESQKILSREGFKIEGLFYIK
tara:strand:- start:297 stop:710 length:414 start_codon:yes stop_codon:yes gene_type:complete